MVVPITKIYSTRGNSTSGGALILKGGRRGSGSAAEPPCAAEQFSYLITNVASNFVRSPEKREGPPLLNPLLTTTVSNLTSGQTFRAGDQPSPSQGRFYEGQGPPPRMKNVLPPPILAQPP